jgi:hypothetical protein
MINCDQTAAGLLVIMVGRGGGVDVPGQIDMYTEIEMAKHRRKPV